jgi:hypothetical protein
MGASLMILVYCEHRGTYREMMVEVEVEVLDQNRWYCKSTEAWMQYILEDDRDGITYVFHCNKKETDTYHMVGTFIEFTHTGE